MHSQEPISRIAMLVSYRITGSQYPSLRIRSVAEIEDVCDDDRCVFASLTRAVERRRMDSSVRAEVKVVSLLTRASFLISTYAAVM